MQIYSNITPTPISKQNFNGYKIYRVPNNLSEKIVKNESFLDLAKICDITVLATAKKAKWSDPFRLRIPKDSEKASLSCTVNSLKTGETVHKFYVDENGKFYGNLEVMVGKMLKKIEEIDMLERLYRVMEK